MPATQDPDRATRANSREAILEAATELFSRRGFANASMSEIADRANVAKSLIHHHFASKRELWTVVRRSVAQSYFDVQNQIIDAPTSDIERVEKSAEAYFRFLQKRPEVVRLIGWSLLEDDEVFWIDDDMLARGVASVDTAKASGIFRADVDSRCFIIQFMALIVHYFESRKELARVAPDRTLAELDETYLENVKKLVTRGVLAR